MTVDRIMQHAGLDSIKPSDLLKTKGLPESQDAAYGGTRGYAATRGPV
nr:hypothetical protein [Xylella fastidiosa]